MFHLTQHLQLDAELNIKIGDFGLCRRVSDEYQVYLPTTHRELPFAWMAPEAIDSEKFTFKNDVWAYGIVMWELITRGLNPYGNMTGNQVLRFLQSGQRLQAPPYTPEQLYNQIILPCWDEDPERRPSFSQLLQELDNLVVSLQRNNLQQLSSRYEKLSPRNVPSIRSQDIFNRYC
ncbi:hypothetical protein OESDEN_00653 [Oesophagostomum dentatum]|uniref:Protein kinase domain-containing protein n=1 Tax=Oesophagostomum dentatum TaxID=61180 RepID=A0A0B1TQ15_OESDE|nr:hypothetical protein OESDEN_00653 [Oesophagostomum dentatum]